MRFLRASPPSHHGAVYMLCSHCVDIVHPRHTYAPELREVISPGSLPRPPVRSRAHGPRRYLCLGAFAVTAPVIYLALCCEVSASELRGCLCLTPGWVPSPGPPGRQQGTEGGPSEWCLYVRC